ncbi:cyclophilin-like fold protein [Raoultella terrigena]|jgi:hypothetical protein|uniref:cyclophilin-like fold protein n=1 Tax=Raoultella terrigena TaxID=577 RepID=UPI001D18A7F6|nr:cyclophilin-like fold protein [Raoultella terrigena]
MMTFMNMSVPIFLRRLRGNSLSLIAGSLLSVMACAIGAAYAEPALESTMKIRLNVDGQIATAVLYDNASTRAFVAQLPLSLTLTDYAQIERIAYLPRKLPKGNIDTTLPVKAGDIAYYAPWGNLAIFAEDGSGNYSGDLMRLGSVDTGLTVLQHHGPLQVRIERITD